MTTRSASRLTCATAEGGSPLGASGANQAGGAAALSWPLGHELYSALHLAGSSSPLRTPTSSTSLATLRIRVAAEIASLLLQLRHSVLLPAWEDDQYFASQLNKAFSQPLQV